MYFAYSALLSALADDTIDDSLRTAAFGVGLIIVPFVFLVLAFGSRHPRAPGAVLKSLGVWVLVAVVISARSIVLGLVVGFGLAGMLSLRTDHPRTQRARLWALLFAVLYVVMLIVVAPGIGLFAAGTIPFIALGFADQYLDAQRRGAGPEGTDS